MNDYINDFNNVNTNYVTETIFIDNEYLLMQYLDVYLVISYISKRFHKKPTITFSTGEINKVLFDTFEMSSKRKRYIRDAIEYLITERIIDVVESCGDYFEIVNNFIITKVNKFTMITLLELKTVTKLAVGRSNKLINYFIFVLSTINQNTKVSFYSIDKLADVIGINASSVKDYNRILEDANLLFIYRFSETKIIQGVASKMNNLYGRPSDKIAIETYAKNRVCKLDEIDANLKLDSNAKRSISKQYNDYVNGTYTGDVSSLYDKCKLYNKAKPDKEKDLSVFDGAFDIDIDDEPTYKYINNDERFGNPFN